MITLAGDPEIYFVTIFNLRHSGTFEFNRGELLRVNIIRLSA